MPTPHRRSCAAVLAGAAGMLFLSGCASATDLAAQLADSASVGPGAHSVAAGEVASPAPEPVATSTPDPTSVPKPVEATPTAAPSPTATPSPASDPTPQPAAADAFNALAADLTTMATQSDRHVGVTLVEIGGTAPQRWSLHGADSFTAASTYKLPVLMWNAQGVAAGRLHDTDTICYQDGDYETGWYDDYTAGACYTRLELATRVGQHSDNTAAHMLVRDMGGSDVLNGFVRTAGAVNSNLWDPNTTTPDDLATLWSAEDQGALGGASALQWLTPLLSHNETNGILAGLPPTAAALAKWGWIDDTENEAALVLSAKDGPYILVVMTSGDGSDQGWNLLTSLSARVWQYESQRA
jgi:beta-lactamase class A